jgi:outer membrane protein assembly factor BamB
LLAPPRKADSFGCQVDADNRGYLLTIANPMSKLKSQRKSRLVAALRCVVLWPLVGLAFCCQGADWPQFRGSNHDGVSTDHINPQWSGAVTNPLWVRSFPNSLCGFVVGGARAFTQINQNINSAAREVCVGLSITDGAELWATAVDDAYYPDGFVGYDDGPRTTPSFDSGSVFVLTSYLKLYRLDASGGAVIWQKDLVALYDGTVIRYQNAASPLIEGGLIYLNANCGSSSLMALRTSDGSVAWRTQNDALTHSTPVLATLQGVRQLIFATGSGLVSLNPVTGAVLWRCNYPSSWTYNPLYTMAVSPVVNQDMVFMSAVKTDGYGSFVTRVTLASSVWTTTQLWSASDPSTAFITPVARDGCVYGTFGAENNSPTNQLKCVNMLNGAVKWSQAGFGRGGLLMVGNYLMALTETGQLVLAQVNTNTYVEVGRFQALPTSNVKCWNVPAIADGKVYVRSTSYGAAYDLSLPNSSPAIAVGPASLNLGSLQAGTCASGTFYVTNLGGGTLTGSVSGAAMPFSLVSGGSYNLSSNAWQAVVVQYSPTVPGSDNLTLTFAGGSGATRPVTGSAYPKALLTLDPPWPAPGNQCELTIRTADGTQMDFNRLAGMEVRASTNLALSASAWPQLTNNLLLTNGVARVLNVDRGPSRRYFIVREPQ